MHTMIPIPNDDKLMLLRKKLGKTIRSARKQQGLTQPRLAAQSRIHVSHLSKIERGQANVTLGSLFAITGALGTTVAGLFHETCLPDSQRAP
jgi:transcriptional regulator with XRE-family HTH domain